MAPPLEVGKPLPTRQKYGDDRIARAFWRLSYRCGRDYAQGSDSRNLAILINHEREDAESYKRRMRIAKPRNHCGPIVRKYNDFVFRRPAARPGTGELYELLKADADGSGTPLEKFMRSALRQSQIERESWLFPDSNKDPSSPDLSVAQAKESGVRPVLRRIGPDAVPWWQERNGVVTTAVVILEGQDGAPFARLYDETSTIDITLKDPRVNGVTPHNPSYEVASIGAATPHNAGGCPLVRLRPMFDEDSCDADRGESQIAPLAELQQAIFNLVSLLMEELYNVTFTQAIVTGVSADQVKDANVGNNTLICIPDPNAKYQMIGADPAQATSIRLSIQDEQRELYRIAGIQTSDPLDASGQAESGVARAFKFNDLAANLSALADACQFAENQVVARLFTMNGQEVPAPADYPGDFDMPVFADELEVLVRTLTVASLPKVIKRTVAGRFADRNLALSEDDKAQMLAEVDDAAEVAASASGSSPFPERKQPTDVGANAADAA